MNCGRSGAAERLRRPLAVGVLLGLLAACAAPPPACDGSPDCAIELRFAGEGGRGTAVVEGELSPDQPSVSYRFHAVAGSRLHWTLRGPAAHLLLGEPDGTMDGPGLPATVPLAQAGAYVFSLSANTMSDAAYGRFRLELRLSRTD